MDAIEGLDDGAYAHFTFQAKQQPEILQFMLPAYYISSHVGVLGLVALAVGICVLRRKWRSAAMTLLAVVAAFAAIQLAQTFVPRPRPQDAGLFLNRDNIFFLGESATVSSYPSVSVFLSTLALILLGRALWDLLPQGLRMVYSILAGFLIVWISLSQFFFALHYVTDVIGGIAGGTLFGWIACLLTPADSPPVVVAPVTSMPVTDITRL